MDLSTQQTATLILHTCNWDRPTLLQQAFAGTPATGRDRGPRTQLTHEYHQRLESMGYKKLNTHMAGGLVWHTDSLLPPNQD